jgi:hypothetical protein
MLRLLDQVTRGGCDDRFIPHQVVAARLTANKYRGADRGPGRYDISVVDSDEFRHATPRVMAPLSNPAADEVEVCKALNHVISQISWGEDAVKGFQNTKGGPVTTAQVLRLWYQRQRSNPKSVYFAP